MPPGSPAGACEPSRVPAKRDRTLARGGRFYLEARDDSGRARPNPMIHDKKPRTQHDDPFHTSRPHPGHGEQHAAGHGPAPQHDGKDTGHGPHKADQAALTGLFGGMYGDDDKKPAVRSADEVALRSRLNQYFSAWSHYGGTFDSSPAIGMYRPNASIEDIAPNMEKLAVSIPARWCAA